ncbi:Fur-regulated basic protein FbpA [Sediminibacillus massiliensis]|uniref:Fur-regulated basic protein FbpA n=1 Tax=Sediminibacillus massiliensis TaxID=1926277 RepID=UPI0009886630|nr:Fur-regulated basic protein FbpA [Sediminibacillus massiliensis]
MSYLREAVEQQKQAMIRKLISEGIVSRDDTQISSKTVAELLEEYQDALKDYGQSILKY